MLLRATRLRERRHAGTAVVNDSPQAYAVREEVGYLGVLVELLPPFAPPPRTMCFNSRALRVVGGSGGAVS